MKYNQELEKGLLGFHFSTYVSSKIVPLIVSSCVGVWAWGACYYPRVWIMEFKGGRIDPLVVEESTCVLMPVTHSLSNCLNF